MQDAVCSLPPRRCCLRLLRQLARSPEMLRVVLLAPVIQLLIFGYAVSTDVR